MQDILRTGVKKQGMASHHESLESAANSTAGLLAYDSIRFAALQRPDTNVQLSDSSCMECQLTTTKQCRRLGELPRRPCVPRPLDVRSS